MQPIDTQWIPWAIIIIGWFVINAQHNKRELRKELRSSLDDIRNRVVDLENLAVLYHTDENNHDLSTKIKVLIERIGYDIETNQLLPSSVSNERIIHLRQAITMKNFETKSYHEQSQHSDIVRHIHWHSSQLIQSLEYHFRVKYPI